MNENLNIKPENGSMTFTSRVVFVRFNFNQDRDKKNPDFDICVDKYTRTPKRVRFITETDTLQT